MAYSLNYAGMKKLGEVTDQVYTALTGHPRHSRSTDQGDVNGRRRNFVAHGELGPHTTPHFWIEVMDATPAEPNIGTQFRVDAWHPDNREEIERAVKKVRRSLAGN